MEGLGTRINMEISKIELAPAKCRRVFFLQGEPCLSLDFSPNFSRLNSFVPTKNRDRSFLLGKIVWRRCGLIRVDCISIWNDIEFFVFSLSRILEFKDFSLPRILTFFYLNYRLTFKCTSHFHTITRSFLVSHSTSQIFKSSKHRTFASLSLQTLLTPSDLQI